MSAEREPSRILVLANPRVSRKHPGLNDAIKTHLAGATLETVEGPAAMSTRARAAADEGFERIVVAGGDGTVGVVIRALVDTGSSAQGPALGIIPIGTFNNFARSLGIPTDVAEACSVIESGTPAPVDLGRVISRSPATSFVFKEVVGVGIDALAFADSVDVAGPQKIPLGAMAAVSALLKFRLHPVKFRFSTTDRWERCTQLLVANTPTFCAAFPVAPEALLDDKLFHVISRTWRGRLHMLAELPRILSGRHCELERDSTRTASKVLVTGHSKVLLHADGEFFCRMPATIEMLAGAIRIIRPTRA